MIKNQKFPEKIYKKLSLRSVNFAIFHVLVYII